MSGLRFRFAGSSVSKDIIGTVTLDFNELTGPISGTLPQQLLSPFKFDIPSENSKALIWAQFLSPYIRDNAERR